MRNSVGSDYLGQNKNQYSIPQPRMMLHTKCQAIWCKQGHNGNTINFWHICKKLWGRVKTQSPANKKWIFQFCPKVGFRNHLQTFWPFVGWIKVRLLS